MCYLELKKLYFLAVTSKDLKSFIEKTEEYEGIKHFSKYSDEKGKL
jgi:hypothetical protein